MRLGDGRPEPAGRSVRGAIRAVHLLLTTACNLRCNYCYQDRRSGREMPWRILRRTLDWILGPAAPVPRIIFSGGEPLLALPLIRRAIPYAEETLGRNPSVGWVVQTNGLLLDPEVIEFFAAHGCEIHLSFDGIPSAQDFRAKGTFDHLDGLLDQLRGRHSELLHDRLTVMMTVAPDTVGCMAESFAYFLGKGVASLSISPAHAPPECYPPARRDEMADQFERIGDLSISHYRDRGEVPLLFLRGDGGPSPHPWHGRSMCGVMRGESIAVDVDGSVYGCAMLIERAAARSRPWLAGEQSRLRIGRIDEPSLESALAAFTEKAGCSAILTHKERKRSSFARCATCRAIGDCDLCPISIGLISGNDDPDLVPDFACAFYRAASRARERFLRETEKMTGGTSVEAPGDRST